MVEDVLNLGLSLKLMRYLRTRILGEVNISQKDASFLADNKHPPTPVRGREEIRCRLRQVLDASRLDGLRPGDEGLSGVQGGDRERNICIRQAHGDESWGDGGESLRSKLTDSSSDVVGMYVMIEEDADLNRDGWNTKDFTDGRSKSGERPVGGRSTLDEDADENVRDESSRRRVNPSLSRSRGKGRVTEGTLENERTLTSPGLRLGGMSKGYRDKSHLRNEDVKMVLDTRRNSGRTESDGSATVEDCDERFRGCTVGSRDISEIVKEATRAAEEEARTANAPEEAIKAAGDAAAELVKTAAFEVSLDTIRFY